LNDRQDWSCLEPHREMCDETLDGIESLCGGGEVVFNTSHPNFLHSLVVEHKWICKQKHLGPGILSASYAGAIISSLIFGQLSDKYGRKQIFSITNLLYIVLRLVAFHITWNYYLFMFLIIIGNTFFPVGVRIGYTLLSEICDEHGRRMAYINGWVFWVVGMAAIPFVAKWLVGWYSFGLFTTLINVVIVFMHPFLPESPRWLITEKKYAEAASLINKIRIINGHQEMEDLEDKLEKNVGGETETEDSFLSALMNGAIIRLFTTMAVLWTVNDFFYVAGTLNAENLSGDIFINFSLISLTEMPSVFIGQFLIDKFGRRWMHVACMVLATLPLAISIFVVEDERYGGLLVGLTMASKTASNVGWFIMWVQAIEIFPTPLRNTGLTVSAVVATLVCMTGPYVVDLGLLDKRLPFLVFTIFGVFGIIFTSVVPESKGLPLAETRADIVSLVREFRFFSWRTWGATDRDSQISERKPATASSDGD